MNGQSDAGRRGEPFAPIIWLHLGLHKTGTTFLQQLFDRDRDWLIERGVLFPKTGLRRPKHPSGPDSMMGHSRLKSALLAADKPAGAALLGDLAAEIERAAPRHVLISSETFLTPDRPLDPEAAAEALGRFGTVRPVVILRRHDGYAESLFHEMLCWSGIRPTYGIGRFVRKRALDWLDYEARLEPWSRVFGSDILLMSYDDLRAGPGILGAMLDLMDVGDTPPSASGALVHSSLNPALGNLMRAVNARQGVSDGRKAAISYALKTQAEWAATPEERAATALPPDLRAEIRANWGAASERLAQRVLGPSERLCLTGSKDERPLVRQRHSSAEAPVAAEALLARIPEPVPRPETMPAAAAPPPRLGLCCLLRQDPEQVRAWIAYHLNMGIERIALFFDNPGDPMLAELAGHPRVKTVPCTTDLWLRLLGRPPEKFSQKNMAARAEGQRLLVDAGMDWIGGLDSDELLHGDLVAALTALRPEARLARIETAEAILHDDMAPTPPFGSRWFKRVPARDRELRRIVANEYAPLDRFVRHGFLGHTQGKSFVHRTANVTIWRSHRPRLEEGQSSEWTEGLLLLHYDCMTYPIWREKWARRIDGRTRAVDIGDQRRAQQDAIASLIDSGDEDALRATFDAWFFFEGSRLLELERMGLATRLDIPDAAFRSGGSAQDRDSCRTISMNSSEPDDAAR